MIDSPVGHCPATSCADGKRKQDIMSGGDVPTGVSLRDGEALYRCPYCGLMWTQRGSDRPGILRRLEARAVGFQKIGEAFETIPAAAPLKFDENHYRSEP